MSGQVGFKAAVAIAAVLLSAAAKSAHATLVWYYDPATGNVAFDTAATRSGTLHMYALNGSTVPLQFRNENLIRLSTSTFFTSTPQTIGDSTQGDQWQGLYTIGNVLPPNLTEATWTTYFTPFFVSPPAGKGSSYYVDIVGGGTPPAPEFHYGAPSGQFVNHYDLLDPATLQWATSAKLVYNPFSGEVRINSAGAGGGYITGISLESSADFIPSGFQTSIGTGPFFTLDDSTVFFVVNLIEPGEFSLGQILPTGLSASELASTLTSAKFSGRAGFKSKPLDFDVQGINLQITVVPEPASLVLGSLAAVLGVGLCRRRKSRISQSL